LTEITEWGSATSDRRLEILAAAGKRRTDEASARTAADTSSTPK